MSMLAFILAVLLVFESVLILAVIHASNCFFDFDEDLTQLIDQTSKINTKLDKLTNRLDKISISQDAAREWKIVNVTARKFNRIVHNYANLRYIGVFNAIPSETEYGTLFSVRNTSTDRCELFTKLNETTLVQIVPTSTLKED